MALTDKLSAIGQAIRDMTGKTEMLTLDAMPGEIRSIEGGGGSSADVRYVTFMSYDGTVEYGKKAVAVGDDCADPIARGIFETPTRESDVQYNYTFAGWATTVNGALDSNALKAVTEDRTVYANYISAVRYYTITYYDDDGTTVLKTESLAYGSTPSYTPTKTDCVFTGWIPELQTVTGNASYTAVFIEQPSFASSSWENIVAAVESGNASAYFAIGDTREDSITYEDGTTENITWVISDFGASALEDGTRNKMGIVMAHCLTEAMQMDTSTSYLSAATNYPTMTTTQWLNTTFYNALPEALRNAVKKKRVCKAVMGNTFTSHHCWLLAIKELGSNPQNTSTSSYGNDDDGSVEAFPLFSSNARRIRKLGQNGEAVKYWTRTYRKVNSKYGLCLCQESGAISNQPVSENCGTSYGKHGVVVGVCL